MGTLMEATKVNSVTGRYRARGAESDFYKMGAPREAFYTDTLHTYAINTRETEFGSLVEPIPITLKSYEQYHPCEYRYPSPVIPPLSPVVRVHEIERPSPPKCVATPVKEDKDDKVVRPPPKKKWIKEYLEEEPKSPASVRLMTGLSVTARSNGVVRPDTPETPCLVIAHDPVPEPAVIPRPPSLLSPAPAVIPRPPPLMSPAPAVIPRPQPLMSPAPAVLPRPPPLMSPVSAVIPPAPLHDYVQEHSRPRTTSVSHGIPQIPSPPSVGSSGSGSSGCVPRAGTREVHNKLEKNRRAHLKECFELLKRQLPATSDDKKTSNLSILGSAIRYIQVLRRKEREYEHEMERLAREKIAAQQRLAALRREISMRAPPARPHNIDDGDESDDSRSCQGSTVGVPTSVTSSPPRSMPQMESSPPHTLNLSTKLRTLPLQITPTTSQVVRTSYGTRHHNTLTLTTLAQADSNTQNGPVMENGVTNTLSTTLVHPAQILPITQVVGSGGLVVGPAALQLLSAGGGLRVLQAPAVHTNGVVTSENSRITKENGLVSPTPVSTDGTSVMVSGLTPLVMSQPGTHLLQTHTLTHKMVETQVVKGGSSGPMTVSTQYLSSTTIVKPVVMVSSSQSPPAPST